MDKNTVNYISLFPFSSSSPFFFFFFFDVKEFLVKCCFHLFLNPSEIHIFCMFPALQFYCVRGNQYSRYMHKCTH